MKVIQLIDLIIDRLAGGDAPQELKGKHHPEIIRKHISLVYDYLINTVVYPQAVRNNNLGYLDPYVKTYLGVEIQEDSDRDEKYSDIPSAYISLPMNRGIRMISPEQGQHKPFLYRDNNSSRLYSNLDVDIVYDEVRFYVEANKVFYSKHISPLMNTVLMKLIVPFEEMDDDDEVNIPTGFGKAIVDMVVDSMLGKPLEKYTNDNNSNTR